MPTLRLDANNIRDNQNDRQLVQVTPSTSMLISSLIQQLCAMIEEDKTRRNKLYYGNLFELVSKYIFVICVQYVYLYCIPQRKFIERD